MDIHAKSILFACAPIGVGSFFFFYGALHFWRAGRELREHGVTAQATVVSKFRKGGGIENYHAGVTFADLEGRPKTLELKVLSRAWHTLREGEPVIITYLAAQPEEAAVGPKWGKQLLGWVFLFYALVGGLMALSGLVVLMRLLPGLCSPRDV